MQGVGVWGVVPRKGLREWGHAGMRGKVYVLRRRAVSELCAYLCGHSWITYWKRSASTLEAGRPDCSTSPCTYLMGSPA